MSETTLLTKIEKGRLKKLLKRANAVENDKPLSGILTASDWKELKDLLAKKGDIEKQLISAVIRYRHGALCDRIVEASDHRDIFFRLLGNSSSNSSSSSNDSVSKKRTRDAMEKDAPKVPSWACIHNVVASDQVVVVELELESPEHLLQIETLIDSCTKDHATCTVPTRWFPGNQPKYMSSQLLYAQRPKPKRLDASDRNIQTLQDLAQTMATMVLTEEELRKEKYPMTSSLPCALAATKREKMLLMFTGDCRPSSIAKAEALAVVARAAHSPLENDELSPFVAAFPATDTALPTHPQIFAMDCEMVRTTVGMELARITLVKIVAFSADATETEVVFDEIVKPKNTVLDYLTPYSGITAEMLDKDDACVSIEQVQATLLAAISAQDIIVGHSLENDFQAARWMHSRVIDTSILFREESHSFKYSLRHLVGTLLKRQIQTADHCSEEDALAALQLAVRRALDGPSFGIYNNRPVNRLCETEGTVVCVGPSDWIQEYVTAQPSAIHALASEDVHGPNCKAISSYMIGKARRARLVYAHLRLRDTATDIAALKVMITDIVAKLPPSATLMFALQAGFAQADKLVKLKRVRMNPKSTMGWTDDEEKYRVQAVDMCQRGMCFWISKH
ncbi:hypothetical protein MPSEU_000247700 [Mayamaea pseudoterrestris]|nr:hypothetical protein MPSEU_000247700 [Mayamaea pseudoterrestris]